MSKFLGYSVTQKRLGMWGQELTGRDTNIFCHKLMVSKFSCNIRLPLSWYTSQFGFS